jgi:lipoprotein-releasing system ATP-binding protein
MNAGLPHPPSAARAPGDTILRAEAVRKAFQIAERSIGVLHGAQIELRRGQRLALMGASGAGKSTFLHILGLLERPTSGKVWLDGQDAWSLPVRERARLRNAALGFVFQFYHLLPELDAVENVMLPGLIRHSSGGGRFDRREGRDRAREMLASFGLAERLTHRPGQLSGGERQRVALARALFLDPPIVIADEPTGNLDTATGERVLELLFAEQERRGLALLLVTHDERIARHCEHVLHMQDGRVLAEPPA